MFNCDPLCEIHANVSKSNYEITSIKVVFQPLISLWFQSFTWPYSVNIEDIKVIFSQNVLYEEWFYVENSNLQKKYLSWVFTEGHKLCRLADMINSVLSRLWTGAKVRIRMWCCSGWRDNAKPDLIWPNRKHIYTIGIIPYHLHCALSAIRCTGNTNTEQVTNLSHSYYL